MNATPKARARRLPAITFFGSGALASGMAVNLRESSYKIDELAVRQPHAEAQKLAAKLGAKLVTIKGSKLEAGILWLAVSDGAIAKVANSLAKKDINWRGKIVLHSSGALSSRELVPLQALGATTASLHPMMSFVRGHRARLSGVCFAVEGDPRAVRQASAIARHLGGTVLRLNPEAKSAYHAFGSLLSPLLVAHLSAALRVAEQAGIERRQALRILSPIIEQTLANVFALGEEKSLSGPLVRGDLATVDAHLHALRGPELALYKALTAYALERLPVRRRQSFTRLLSDG